MEDLEKHVARCAASTRISAASDSGASRADPEVQRSRGQGVRGSSPAQCSVISADKVIYQALDDLQASITDEAAEVGASLTTLDSSCFDGKYVTDFVGESYLTQLERTRSSDRGNSEADPPRELRA